MDRLGTPDHPGEGRQGDGAVGGRHRQPADLPGVQGQVADLDGDVLVTQAQTPCRGHHHLVRRGPGQGVHPDPVLAQGGQVRLHP